jgi:hypothetical protein
MTVAPNITYGIRWSVEVVAIPLGAGQMEVPSAQRLKLTQGSTAGGGIIVVASTGLYPTSTNFTNACTTAGTNMGTALTQTAPLAQIQGFATGGG